jgi:hypothetical protein
MKKATSTLIAAVCMLMISCGGNSEPKVGAAQDSIFNAMNTKTIAELPETVDKEAFEKELNNPLEYLTIDSKLHNMSDTLMIVLGKIQSSAEVVAFRKILLQIDMLKDDEVVLSKEEFVLATLNPGKHINYRFDLHEFTSEMNGINVTILHSQGKLPMTHDKNKGTKVAL